MKTTTDPFADLASLFLTDAEPVPSADHPAPAVPAPRESFDARQAIEFVVPGHLPVMGSLWIGQYADLVGRRLGPVALFRFGEDEVTVEIFRAGTQPVRLDAAADLDAAIASLAGLVRRWIIVPRVADDLDVPPAAGTLTVLTGADDAAVVGAYRLVKALVERWSDTSLDWPRLGCAILGSDQAEAATVAEKLNRTMRAFLQRELPVVATRQRMEPLESCARRMFAFDPASLDPVTLCRTIVKTLRRSRPRSAEAPRPRPAAAGFRLPPKPAMTATRPTVPVEAPTPTPIATGPLPLADLRPLRPRCPAARGISLACDANGGLHLLADPTTLGSVAAAESWVAAQRELLELACPEISARGGEPTVHVVGADPAALLPLVGGRYRVHLATPAGAVRLG